MRPTTRRSLSLTITLYLATLATAGIVLSIGCMYVVSTVQAALGPAYVPLPTRLDEMIASAREVRKALDAPMPPPEPLSPITVKPVRAADSAMVTNVRNRKTVATMRNRNKNVANRMRSLSSEARNAFAADPQLAPRAGEDAVTYDRHKPL
jgi:hypothetical protein